MYLHHLEALTQIKNKAFKVDFICRISGYIFLAHGRMEVVNDGVVASKNFKHAHIGEKQVVTTR